MDPISHPKDSTPKTTGAEMTRKKRGLKFSDSWKPNPDQAQINRERMNGPIAEPKGSDRIQNISKKVVNPK